jgi:hypothetical protein
MCIYLFIPFLFLEFDQQYKQQIQNQNKSYHFKGDFLTHYSECLYQHKKTLR